MSEEAVVERMTAKELFSSKLGTCPITKDGCGYLKGDICHKFKDPKKIEDIAFAKNGERKVKCPYINRRSRVEHPEQIDWVG
jgi:hypothetical protein